MFGPVEYMTRCNGSGLFRTKERPITLCSPFAVAPAVVNMSLWDRLDTSHPAYATFYVDSAVPLHLLSLKYRDSLMPEEARHATFSTSIGKTKLMDLLICRFSQRGP